MSGVTFVAHCRPFAGVFDEIQRTAIASWRGAVEDSRIVLVGPDLPGDLDVDERRDPEPGLPTLRGIWRVATAQQTDWLCVVESDIVLSASLARVLGDLVEVERPFVIGQRWDVEPGQSRELATLHPPSAISYCVLRGRSLSDADVEAIPPFWIGRTLHDNWLVWAALHRWHMTVIDATEALTAAHLNHPYLEHGSKQGMFESRERADNERLARASGMARPYGVNDAPWVLRGGKLQKRGT